MDTARAVTGVLPLPLRAAGALVRVGAVVELVLGLVALARPSPLAAGAGRRVRTSDSPPSSLLVRARGGPLATCGCFGTPDTPATRTHVAVTLGLGVSAVAVSASVSTGWITGVLAGSPWRGVPVVLLSVLCAWLAYLAMARLAELGAVRRLLGVTRGPTQ